MISAAPTKRARREWVFPALDLPDGFQPGATELVRRVLWSRREVIGSDLDAFLQPRRLPIEETRAMKGMAEAVALVAETISSRRPVAIFGDYDADGVTATALLQRGLRLAGAEVITYIPHRVNDGYGLSPDGLAELDRQGAALVISCDCGTNSVDVVAGRPAGQRLVVTDHHLPASEIARPDALLNPHQPGCPYPFKDLSGAGVAFKLLEALWAEPAFAGRLDPGELDQVTQLVAIGAVADVVPLLGENRALVRQGLAVLDESPLPGVRALIEVGMMRRPLDSGAIGFQLAPRINAAGRMDDARLALDLLLAETMDDAYPLAEHLERHNQSRKAATERALVEVAERLEQEGVPDSAIVIADERWPLGLVGLIAGRLVDRHHMPAFVLNREGDECRGSARSVHGFNVVDALAACEAVLSRYGGHEMAAGLALPAANLPALVDGIQAYAEARRPEGGWSRRLPADGVVDFDALTPDAVESLAVLEPFGEGLRAPRFCVRDVELKAASAFGGDGDHMRLWFAQGERMIEAIAWRKGEHVPFYRAAAQKHDRLDALFSVEVNRWDGDENVRLELEDLRRASATG
ncbi:MAG: single-stranded-DNA-specific exonuclease RecJ [Candidatus Dormiibacterota bacterium]